MEVQEIVKLKKGDSEVWNMMVDRYSKSVYNIALNFAGNSDDASDITQDIFLKVYNNIEKFHEDGNFKSWLLRLAKNHCIDYWRKNKINKSRVELDDNIHTMAEDIGQKTPEDTIIQKHDAYFLREKLKILPPELRLLIILRDIQGKSYQEIADEFQIPLGTTKSRINRARAKLAKIILSEGKKNGM